MLQREAAKALAPMFGRSNCEGPHSGPGVQLTRRIPAEQRRRDDLGQDEEPPTSEGRPGWWAARCFVYATGRPVGLMACATCERGWRAVLFNQTMYESRLDAKPSEKRATSSRSPSWMSDGLQPVTRRRGLDAASTAKPSSTLCPNRDRLPPTFGIKPAECDAALLGQAMWSYVADIYGLPTVANVLYMTRVTQSPSRAGSALATGSYLAGFGLGSASPPPCVKRQKGHDRHVPAIRIEESPATSAQNGRRRDSTSPQKAVPIHPVCAFA